MYSIVISMYIWRRLRRLSSTNRPWHWKKNKKNTTRERFFTLPHPPFVLDVHFVLFFSFTWKQKKKKKIKFSSLHTLPVELYSLACELCFIIKTLQVKKKKRERRKFTSFLVQVQGLDRCIGAALPCCIYLYFVILYVSYHSRSLFNFVTVPVHKIIMVYLLFHLFFHRYKHTQHAH